MNSYYVSGMIVGVLTVLLLALANKALLKKTFPFADEYDERQMIARGKAFQAGFYTLLVGGAAYNVLNVADILPGSSFAWNMCILLLGVAVFAVTAIHLDAYIGFHTRPKRFLIGGGCIMAVMLVCGIANLMGDAVQKDIGILNLAVCVLWVVIEAAMLLHDHAAKKDAEE